MIKQAFIISLLLASAEAVPSSPCTTCAKSYVNSSLEGMLLIKNKDKGQKKLSLSYPLLKDKAKDNKLQKLTTQDSAKKAQQNLEKWTSPIAKAWGPLSTLGPRREGILKSAQAVGVGPFSNSNSRANDNFFFKTHRNPTSAINRQ